MNAAQIPYILRFKLWGVTVETATYLNNLVVVTVNGVTKTRWEYAGFEMLLWSKNLRTYGEAGTVKEGKRGKVLDRGVTMMFVGYSRENPANCYKMFNPTTSRLTLTRDNKYSTPKRLAKAQSPTPHKLNHDIRTLP
jgi:hypothetical protein